MLNVNLQLYLKVRLLCRVDEIQSSFLSLFYKALTVLKSRFSIFFIVVLYQAIAPFPAFSEILEVALPTRVQKTPVYLSRLHVPSSEYDWRYFEELREVFEFDLNNNGFTTVLSLNDSLDEILYWPDVRSGFNLDPWKKESVSFVLAIQVLQNKLQLIVFDIGKGSSKKYVDVPLSGKAEIDRTQIHRLADLVQKDLFGVDGISSLKIVYSKRCKAGEEWSSEIWVCDSDGANARPVIRENGYCVSPGFFPPGISRAGEIYYVSFQEGQSKIYRSSLQRTGGDPMVLLRGSQALPSMNRIGNQIAFISDVAGRPDLFIQNLDRNGKMIGKARQLFTAPRATQASPTYSPDGKQIAFVSDKDGSPRIYIIDVLAPKDTKRPSPRLITKANRENTSPAWSPDGKKLAYSAKVDGVRQIWVYDFAMNQERAVTNSPDNKENPSWAPDNLHLIYNTESEDRCELFRIHIHHGESVQISKDLDQKRFASWSFEKF